MLAIFVCILNCFLGILPKPAAPPPMGTSWDSPIQAQIFKGTVTQVISKHKKIELAPNMFNILKMSKGDVFRIFDFAREVS